MENLTAKGGDLLSRTTENFKGPSARDTYGTHDSDGSSGDEITTPKDDRMETEDPGSGAGRTTRGLRQAPPPRVLFQPDTSSSRQARHGSANQQSPQPSGIPYSNYNGFGGMSNPPHLPSSLANYEPRPQMPLTLRPVTTPGNNLGQFISEVRRDKEARLTHLGINFTKTKDGMMKPGAGFDGPNIYVRTLQGLRSGLPQEENYALHHLVKISHERGDKYKFEAFPNLAEGLVEYALRISSLFYDVQWEISYSNDVQDLNILDGMNGTPDILQRIQCLDRLDKYGGLETWEQAHTLTKVHEAALTIRNLCMLEENAVYLSTKPQARDFLSIALNLPQDPLVTEFRHYAFDICEQLTRYWVLDAEDPLYRSLLSHIKDQTDRGAILTSLRALCRISMHLEEHNRLLGVPLAILKQLNDYLTLQDDELVQTSLEFLYIFSANIDNVAMLLANADEFGLPALMDRGTNLLQHHASEHVAKQVSEKAIASAEAKTVPVVPNELMQEFLQLKEPERSTQWLRSVFEEKADSEITQIALWHAYQSRFTEHATGQEPLLPAADFIKNVSTIFTHANAEVIEGPPHRFVIRGIGPRHSPIDMKGRIYTRCLWTLEDPGLSEEPKRCDRYALKPNQLFDHVAKEHLGIPTMSEGGWDLEAAKRAPPVPQDCLWAGCKHFSWNQNSPPSPYELAMHVKTHLADATKKSLMRQGNNRTVATQTSIPTSYADDLEDLGRQESYLHLPWYNVITDERHDPTGIPLMSLLLLRNIARNVPKAVARITDQASAGSGAEDERTRWLQELFQPLSKRLFEVTAYNRTMSRHVLGLLSIVERGINI